MEPGQLLRRQTTWHKLLSDNNPRETGDGVEVLITAGGVVGDDDNMVIDQITSTV